MKLRHLGLPVRELDRSLEFYVKYFGFDATTAQTYPDGTVIVRDADGFDLALHPSSDVIDHSSFLHFGFALPTAMDVRMLRAGMESDGIPIVEVDEEPDLVSFKCLDPDGWRVELYWEVPQSTP